MVRWKMGDQAQAREWYAKAVRWIKQNRPYDDDLAHVCDEAEILMAGRPAP